MNRSDDGICEPEEQEGRADQNKRDQDEESVPRAENAQREEQ